MSDSFVHDLLLTIPIPVLAIGILLVVLLGRKHSGIISTFMLIASAVSVETLNSGKITAFNGLILVSGTTILIWKMCLWLGVVISFITSATKFEEEHHNHQEFFILFLTSILGGLVFVSCNEFLTMFFALELLSLPLYCLCGSSLFRKESTEAALKYFILGSFSSAFFLFGVSILYGLYGTTIITTDLMVVQSGLHVFAVGLIVLGILFKLGAAPIHYWVPDVYEGSPTSVTMFMSTIVKISAFGALIIILSGSIVGSHESLIRMLWMVSLLSMIIGSVGALRQRSLKRILAYSSISHVGYLLIPFIGMNSDVNTSVLFYLFGYSIVSLGLFAFIMPFGVDDSIQRLTGLGKKKPIIAVAFTLLLLSLAGLPPGLLGFFGKFKLFSAGILGGYSGLVIVAVFSTVISLYYYLKLISYMFLHENSDSTYPDASFSSLAGVCISFVVLVLGFLPSILMNWIKA